MENLIWICHICKEERPDAKIDVLKRELHFGTLTGNENIRYCNDKQECIEGAKTYTHFKEDND